MASSGCKGMSATDVFERRRLGSPLHATVSAVLRRLQCVGASYVDVFHVTKHRFNWRSNVGQITTLLKQYNSITIKTQVNSGAQQHKIVR